MVRLLLVRHAATAVSGGNVLLGSTDMAASSEGLQQLVRLPALLKDYNPTTWFCSPLKRAIQTAEELSALGSEYIQFIEDERLREIDFGCWENKRVTDIVQEEPEQISSWSAYDDFVFPEGEAAEKRKCTSF